MRAVNGIVQPVPPSPGRITRLPPQIPRPLTRLKQRIQGVFAALEDVRQQDIVEILDGEPPESRAALIIRVDRNQLATQHRRRGQQLPPQIRLAELEVLDRMTQQRLYHFNPGVVA